MSDLYVSISIPDNKLQANVRVSDRGGHNTILTAAMTVDRLCPVLTALDAVLPQDYRIADTAAKVVNQNRAAKQRRVDDLRTALAKAEAELESS